MVNGRNANRAMKRDVVSFVYDTIVYLSRIVSRVRVMSLLSAFRAFRLPLLNVDSEDVALSSK